jgi:hypothetical protein
MYVIVWFDGVRKMFKTDKIEKLVEYVILSGFIDSEGSKHCPLSLILIAPPETAKTSILLSFKSYRTLELTDLSPKAIRDYLIPKLDGKEIDNIVVPDLLKVLSHKPATVMATTTLLNGLMEEGMQDSLFLGQEFHLKERVYCGIITSITTNYYHKMFWDWNDIGFTSRLLPVAYDYSADTIREIHESIQNGEVFGTVKEFKKGDVDEKYNIKIPSELGSMVSKEAQSLAVRLGNFSVSKRIGKKFEDFHPDFKGFRLQKQMRQLLKAIALSRALACDRTAVPTVTLDDYKELDSIIDYINMPNTVKML